VQLHQQVMKSKGKTQRGTRTSAGPVPSAASGGAAAPSLAAGASAASSAFAGSSESAMLASGCPGLACGGPSHYVPESPPPAARRPPPAARALRTPCALNGREWLCHWTPLFRAVERRRSASLVLRI